MSLPLKRLQQANFEAARAVNRFAGTGGGSGLVPMALVGQSSYTTNQTTGNTSPTNIPGSSVTFDLQRPTGILGMAGVSAFMNQNPPIAAGNVIIDSGGSGSSFRLRYPFINSSKVSIVQTALLFLVIQPGTQTWSLQYYVDTSPDTVTVNDFHFYVFALGY